MFITHYKFTKLLSHDLKSEKLREIGEITQKLGSQVSTKAKKQIYHSYLQQKNLKKKAKGMMPVTKQTVYCAVLFVGNTRCFRVNEVDTKAYMK